MNHILLTKNQLVASYKSQKHAILALNNYDQWFPIKSNPVLSGIIADLMADGHIQGPPRWRIDYTSNSIIELKRFSNNVRFLFGISGTIRNCTTNKFGSMNLGINNMPLARTLIQLGVPFGAKVTKSYKIPQWILNDKIYFRMFVNRYFSCECCVDTYSNAIQINMYKMQNIINSGHDFFNSIKYYLEYYFGIIATNPFLTSSQSKRKDGTVSQEIRMKIRRKQSIIDFHKYIGLSDPLKKIKLKKIVKKASE